MSQVFAAYNKNNGKGNLTGNWVEEEALRAATGFSRRKVPGAVLSPESKESRWEPTHDRVLRHDANSDQMGYETTNQARTNYGDGVLKLNPGPRSSLREASLVDRARMLVQQELQSKREAEAEEREQSKGQHTITQTSFHAPDSEMLLATKRVPKGRNGARIVDATVQHLTRGEVDSLDRMKLDMMQQQTCGPSPVGYAQGVAVTHYSHALTTGMAMDFATTCSDTTNPFARSSAFTNEIRDPTKHHGEAMDPGSAHDERIGMSAHQRSALKRLLQSLHADSSLLAHLTDRFNESEYIQLPAFRSVLADLPKGTSSLTDKDAIHIFMHFDVDHIGAIRMAELLQFCQDPPRL